MIQIKKIVDKLDIVYVKLYGESFPILRKSVKNFKYASLTEYGNILLHSHLPTNPGDCRYYCKSGETSISLAVVEFEGNWQDSVVEFEIL